ncbi:MAG TPA: hypothetical protein VKA94_11050, partial [Hyphomicrobiales bacterium]|nr:hypothetical protein [Hyphomicrobiales bacterium]
MTRRGRFAFAALIAASSALAGCGQGIMPSYSYISDGYQPVSYQPVGIGEDAVKLAVHESGKGEPLVLLHGLGASSYTWR